MIRYDTHDTAKQGWTVKSQKCQIDLPQSKGKTITMLHAGSEDGCIQKDTTLLSA